MLERGGRVGKRVRKISGPFECEVALAGATSLYGGCWRSAVVACAVRLAKLGDWLAGGGGGGGG